MCGGSLYRVLSKDKLDSSTGAMGQGGNGRGDDVVVFIVYSSVVNNYPLLNVCLISEHTYLDSYLPVRPKYWVLEYQLLGPPKFWNPIVGRS